MITLPRCGLESRLRPLVQLLDPLLHVVWCLGHEINWGSIGDDLEGVVWQGNLALPGVSLLGLCPGVHANGLHLLVLTDRRKKNSEGVAQRIERRKRKQEKEEEKRKKEGNSRRCKTAESDHGVRNRQEPSSTAGKELVSKRCSEGETGKKNLRRSCWRRLDERGAWQSRVLARTRAQCHPKSFATGEH